MLGDIVEDRYRIEAELGEGAMGRVYRARHVKVGREVAIKVMHQDLARVPSILERFAREALVAARLRHPNLVSVLDVGQTAGRLPLIVMELAPGTKLSHVIDGALPRWRIIDLTRQLLRGLEHAHAAGLIHRDLKPDNILVETDEAGREVPRIVDFGIAVTAERDDSVVGRRLTEANTVIGTPVYMSPEQARAKPLDHRTDLFSLGVIVYELLSGMTPFPGSSVDVALANASKDPPAIRERAGIEVDPLLESFARKLMARRREDRFQSAAEALAVLELIETDRIAAARALSTPPMLVAPAQPLAVPEPIAWPESSDALETQSVTTFTRVIARTRVPRLAIGIALAFAVLTLAAVGSRSRVEARAPQLAPATVADVEIAARVAAQVTLPALPALPALDVVPAARVAARVDRPRAAASTVTVVAPPVVAASTEMAPPPAITRPGATVLPASTLTAHALAACATQPITAKAVAERYAAVGRALRGSPDELWERYRRIRINDAIGTVEGRQAAMTALAEIERAIR
jgi:serine/threonine-protein kinase